MRRTWKHKLDEVVAHLAALSILDDCPEALRVECLSMIRQLRRVRELVEAEQKGEPTHEND